MFNVLFLFWLVIILLFIVVILQYLKIVRLRKNIKLMEKIKSTLYFVAEKITKTTKEEEVYSLILETAMELIPGASKGSILLLGEDGYFHFRILKGYSDELKKLTIKREEAFLYSINNFKETAIIKNPVKFDEGIVEPARVEYLKSFQALDINCSLSSPIYIDEKLVGLMNVDSTSSEIIFSQEDIALVNHIRNELQLALKNSFIQHRLRYTANFDELTGLFNRRFFKEFFSKELLKIRRYQTEGCLCLIDLDDFKTINDTYGHNMGDRALKFFADILRENIRKSDVYARMSGDEFVILFINCSKEKASERMETVRGVLRNKTLEGIRLSFSYGICSIDTGGEMTPDDIFGAADREMYNDKNKKSSR